MPVDPPGPPRPGAGRSAERLGPPRKDEIRGPEWATAREAGEERLDPSLVLSPTRFVRALPGQAALCDGRRSIAEIARHGGIDLDLTIALVSRLYGQGLVCEASEGTIPPLLFLEHARALGARLSEELLEMRPGLEGLFAGGGNSRRLAAGYLVEATHFIRAATSHIGAAIAHTRDERIQFLLSGYLEDEYWHGLWMERSLIEAGLTKREIERALPLPATLAVVNSWRHAAQTDLLLYGGLIAITESGPGDASRIEAVFERTVEQGVLPDAAWRPYFEHALGDGMADHLGLSQAIFSAGGPLSRVRRDSLRRYLLLHAASVVAMEHAIIDFYSAAEGPRVHALEWSVRE